MSPVYVHQIETAVPAHAFSQDFLCEQMQRWATTERERRYIRGIYPASGIQTRHFAASKDGASASGIFCRNGLDGPPTVPGTETRNTLFIDTSKQLAIDASRRALAACSAISAQDITHVIVVSCTGFYNPGPDYYITKELNLSPHVQRYCLGFMGCHAALPALKMATQFCQADAQAVVLIVCLELCSLHLQFDGSSDALLANALFSDGVAAALVSARPPLNNVAYRLNNFASTLSAEGEKEMAWAIGDHGFRLTLSSYVSKIIGANIQSLLNPVLASWHLRPSDIAHWAVHPGGKTILDRVEEALHLPSDALAQSRAILRDYGNMSSATLLFVLKTMLANTSGPVCALSFGPGLTLEMAHFDLVHPDAPL